MASIHADLNRLNAQHIMPSLTDAAAFHPHRRSFFDALPMFQGLAAVLHDYAKVKMVPGLALLNCTVKVSPLFKVMLEP